MKGQVALEAAVSRLLSINWEAQPRDINMHSFMVGEYIRRVAIMARHYDLKIGSPFFLPSSIFPINEASSSRALVKVVGAAGARLRNAYLRQVCESYLQWSEAFDSRLEVAVAFPDLFDPLIVLMEKGGDFGMHHGEVLLRDGAIPLKRWRLFAAAKPMYP